MRSLEAPAVDADVDGRPNAEEDRRHEMVQIVPRGVAALRSIFKA